MLKAYFDASGTDGRASVVTLAGMVASESVWGRFEPQWKTVLSKYDIENFHMSEAKALQGMFCRENGWSVEKVKCLERDLWNVIGRFRATKKFDSGSNLFGSSCSVFRDGFDRAKKERPSLRSREAVCLNYCFNVLPRDLDSEKRYPDVTLVFDQNEEFLKTVYRNWINYRKLPDAGWPTQIKSIEKGDSSKVIPLQATDLLAWSMNRHRKIGYVGGFVAPILIELYDRTYTCNTLVEQFPNG